MIIEKIKNNVYRITGVFDFQLVQKFYYNCSKGKAIERFKDFLRDLEHKQKTGD